MDITEALTTPEAQPDATPETAAPVADKPPEALSPRLEILAKKEAAFVRQQQELKREREEFMRERESMKQEREEYERFKAFKKNAKLNPDLLEKELGLKYEDWTDHKLRGGAPSGDVIAQTVEERLKDFERRQTEREEQMRAQEKTRAEEHAKQAEADFKDQLRDFVETRQEEYELINIYDQHELVWQTIKEHWDKQVEEGHPRPKILSTKEASDLVEKHLEDLVEKAKSAKKFQPKVEGAAEPGRASEPAKTLTNSMIQASSPSTLPAKTEAERLQRAMAALGG